MSDLKIDNKYLKRLANSIRNLHQEINKDVALLEDENGDLFMRYMAFNRSMAYIKMVDLTMNIYHKAMIGGHNLSDPIFHTEEAIKRDWQTVKAADHPFFDTDNDDDSDDDNEDKVSDLIKTVLGGAALLAMLKAKHDKESND